MSGCRGVGGTVGGGGVGPMGCRIRGVKHLENERLQNF